MSVFETVTCDILGESFELNQAGALYHSKSKSLMVADVHLGKSQTFTQAGAAVPDSTQKDLTRLTVLMQRYSPERLLVIGDLFHDKAGVTLEIVTQLTDFKAKHDSLILELVVGNHDLSAFRKNEVMRKRLAEIMVMTEGDLQLTAQVVLRHYPMEGSGEYDGLVICGHLHPAVSMPMRGGLNTRLPAFIYQKPNLILPAFGSFTGSMTVKLAQADVVWPVTPDGLFTYRAREA